MGVRWNEEYSAMPRRLHPTLSWLIFFFRIPPSLNMLRIQEISEKYFCSSRAQSTDFFPIGGHVNVFSDYKVTGSEFFFYLSLIC